jgi:hypothetical protein
MSTPVAWTWYAFIGSSVTALAALAFSVVWRRSPAEGRPSPTARRP